MPIGLCTYPGISFVRNASFTLSPGVSPSVARIEIAPQQDFSSTPGTLAFTFDRDSVSFPDCKIDKVIFTKSGSGLVWGFDLFDRRWKWSFPVISGRYNIRDASDKIYLQTEKKPRELATLCLEAMGESGFDVSKLPNEARPEIDWDWTNAAAALDSLCESLGCIVVLGLNNRVSIHELGVGQQLPNLPTLTTDSLTVDLPERPDALKIVGGRTRLQYRLTLEAVGLEIEGVDLSRRMKRIDDLSYKPAGGWETADIYYMNDLGGEFDDQTLQAVSTVFRWYLVTGFAGATTLKPPGYTETLQKINQILPLEAGLISHYFDLDGQKQQQAPIIRGTFYDFNGRGTNTSEGERFRGGFSIDREHGIVIFDEPMYKLVDGEQKPADLTLEIAFGIRENKSRQPLRYTKEKRFGGQGFGTKPKHLYYDDLVRNITIEYDESNRPNGKTDNVQEVDGDADRYLTAAAKEYEQPAPRTRSYRGIVGIELDGAIQQVSWSVGVDGGANTQASYSDQHDVLVPTIREQRQLKLLNQEKLRRKEREDTEIAQQRRAKRRLT